MEFPFLKYINNPKDNWIACIRVPYGTSLWQVGDSKEHNGSFNIAMTKAKESLLQYKEQMSMRGTLEVTDIIPLINVAWKQSFARVDKNKNAITDRGWNPYNRNILTMPEVRETMTNQEKIDERSSSTIIIHPNNNSNSITSNDSSNITSDTDMSTQATEIECVSDSIDENPPQLNFSSGQAAFCLTNIVQQKDLFKARENIKKEKDCGKTVREKLEESKRITAGILFKSGSSRLGKTVYDICQKQVDERVKMEKDKVLEMERKYNKERNEATILLSTGKPLEKMTNEELKTLIRPLKLKDDGAMPTKKKNIIACYHQWKHRPPPLFQQLISNNDNLQIGNNDDDNNAPNLNDVNAV